MSVAFETRPLQVARSFFDAYDDHDVDAMLRLCSDHAEVRYVPMADDGRGPAKAVGRTIWAGLIDAFPDLHVDAHTMFGDAANVAAEVLMGGTQQKDFLGIANQGRHYELPHAFILGVEDTGITMVTAYWDNAGFYRQLGATPSR